MNFRTIFRLLVFVLLVTIMVPAPVAASDAGNLAPADILFAETPGHFTLSPDGSNLVYIRSAGTDLLSPKDNGTLMDIDVRSGVETALTHPDLSVTSYAVSPNGNTIVYSAMPRSGGDVSLYLTHVRDTPAVRLKGTTDELAAGFTFLGTDRLVFTGSPNVTSSDAGSTIAYVADEPPSPVILKTYSLKDGTISVLSTNSDVITIWQPSPDGHYVLYKAATDPSSWQTGATFRYVLLDTRTGQEQQLATSFEGYQDTNQFAWSPDSTVVYIERFVNGGLRYPVEDASFLQAYTVSTGTLEDIPLSWDHGLFIDLFNADIEVNPFNGGAYLLLADGTNPKTALLARNGTGWKMSVLSGKDQGNIYAIETDRSGGFIVYNWNSASSPPQLVRADVKGGLITNPVQLTLLNPGLITQDLGISGVTTWKGAGNDTIAGVIRYPPGYVKGKDYPLLLVIHGGPNYGDFDSWRDTWEFPYHLFTSRGAVTLSVNYHGSTNFGLPFARSIEGGNYYDLPVEDMEAGIDHLARMGVINRSRVGVTGWSNGGILGLALITKDPSLKAAVAGAGTADENSQVATTNGIVMDKMYYNQSPYENPQSFLPIVPLYRATSVRTPLLMMIGTEDIQVDPASAWVTYRAYKEGSTAPVRFVLFPGQPHHMKTPETQTRKVKEELDWLDRYLFTQK
jgi:dipeptidyl aminopeptidase/acylaminoacyl peptidase